MKLNSEQKQLVLIYGAASKLFGVLEMAMQNNKLMKIDNTEDHQKSIETSLQILQLEQELGIND